MPHCLTLRRGVHLCRRHYSKRNRTSAQFCNFAKPKQDDRPRFKGRPEASFSIHGHIDTVGKRVSLLQENVADPTVRAFVYDEILPTWEQAKTPAIAAARDRYFEELPYEDRCISPSDFGFHNAILGSGETVRFVDFEYAGWDDPAHLVCDFLPSRHPGTLQVSTLHDLAAIVVG